MGRRIGFAAWVVLLAACHGGSSGGEAAPATSVDAGPQQPLRAAFVTAPQSVQLGKCEQLLLTVVQGAASVSGDALGVGDVVTVVAAAPSAVDVQGSGLLVSATAQVPCETPAGRHVVRATQAPELTFMGGAMRAHLDVDDRAVAPTAYLGRLSGTAPVPEHTHAGSWEVICAVEAAGLFTLAGAGQRLAPHSCVAVPPDVKHAWKPDPGSNLVAVQMYSPPGPEQRFKKLAADYAASGAEAGAPAK